MKKNKKIENFFLVVLRTPQRIRRFACLQDCLLTLTCHLASTEFLTWEETQLTPSQDIGRQYKTSSTNRPKLFYGKN